MIVLTPIDELVSGPFLAALFTTKRMQDSFQSIRTGSTVPHLTCKMVKELQLQLPPRDVQDLIIEEIGSIRTQSDQIKRNYERQLTDIADLRQSLLQKAFSGQLTA